MLNNCAYNLIFWPTEPSVRTKLPNRPYSPSIRCSEVSPLRANDVRHVIAFSFDTFKSMNWTVNFDCGRFHSTSTHPDGRPRARKMIVQKLPSSGTETFSLDPMAVWRKSESEEARTGTKDIFFLRKLNFIHSASRVPKKKCPLHFIRSIAAMPECNLTLLQFRLWNSNSLLSFAHSIH